MGFLKIFGRALEYEESKQNHEIIKKSFIKYTIETIKATDFRTQLYMAGVASQPFGIDSNYYYTELKNEWPKLYNRNNKK